MYCSKSYVLNDLQVNLLENSQFIICPNCWAWKLLSSVYSTWDENFDQSTTALFRVGGLKYSGVF